VSSNVIHIRPRVVYNLNNREYGSNNKVTMIVLLAYKIQHISNTTYFLPFRRQRGKQLFYGPNFDHSLILKSLYYKWYSHQNSKNYDEVAYLPSFIIIYSITLFTLSLISSLSWLSLVWKPRRKKTVGVIKHPRREKIQRKILKNNKAIAFNQSLIFIAQLLNSCVISMITFIAVHTYFFNWVKSSKVMAKLDGDPRLTLCLPLNMLLDWRSLMLSPLYVFLLRWTNEASPFQTWNIHPPKTIFQSIDTFLDLQFSCFSMLNQSYMRFW